MAVNSIGAVAVGVLVVSNNSIQHGGNIVAASSQYGVPLDQWIDLSTGINPTAYPVEFSAFDFALLPYLQADFFAAVKSYYQQDRFLAVAGTQAAIQVLPNCLANLPVLLPSVGYQEHEQYWRENNRQCYFYDSLNIDGALADIEASLLQNSAHHVVIINPNNPTGMQFSLERLNHIANTLSDHACLIVDEAFIDTKPEHSLLSTKLSQNVIVLRSFGKFFGLAGLRLGFVFADKKYCDAIEKNLGIWQVNGPAQRAAIQALTDKKWQQKTLADIANNAGCTRQIFTPLADKLAEKVFSNTELFTSYLMSKNAAYTVCEVFAQAGVLLRVIDIDQQQALLRVGILPQDNERAIKRVTQLITEIVDNEKIISI